MIGEERGDRPLLLAVDADSRQLGRIEGELQRSFGADFSFGWKPGRVSISVLGSVRSALEWVWAEAVG